MYYELNKLESDEFGRISGILAVNKPVGMTSHDVVYAVRKALGTKHVGHAGALDPFATGLLIILVGKATKMSDKYLELDKEYVAQILFGIQTDSADTEGEVLTVDAAVKAPENLAASLKQFTPSYTQFVPIYSSVKVNGEKLRVLARASDSFQIEVQGDKHIAKFQRDRTVTEVELPSHQVKIHELELLNESEVDITGTEFAEQNSESLEGKTTFPSALIRVRCSKGTYIRALAEDIGAKLNPPLPAMLVQLERTKIDDITVEEALNIEDLATLTTQLATS
jgi:tRNA pseudouridine55 synthase